MSKWKKVGRIVGIIGLVVVAAVGFIWWRLYYPPIPPGPAIGLPPILKAEDLKEDNACYWYLKAADKVVWPEWSKKDSDPKVQELLNNINKVRREGWQGEYPDVEELLSGNAEALSLLETGFKQEKAQMPTPENAAESLPAFELRNLVRLQVLQARKAESKGREAEALRYYLNGMRLGCDIQHGSAILGFFIGSVIQHVPERQVQDGMAAHRFQDAGELKRAVLRLNSLREEAPPLSQTFKYDCVRIREDLKKGLRWLSKRTDKEWAKPVSLRIPLKGPRMAEVYEALVSEAIEAADGPYISAVLKFDEMIRSSMKHPVKMWWKYGRLGSFASCEQTKWSICLGVYTRYRVIHGMTEVALALEAYRLENGTYPEALAELVPDYIPEVPLDYFITQPLTYRKTETGYLLYSFGPDMDDDGGKIDIVGLVGERSPNIQKQLLFPLNGVIEVFDGDIVVEVE